MTAIKTSFKFGNNSKAKLSTCHTDFIKIMELAIIRSDIDFGISEGHRPPATQFEYFMKGREERDGKWIVVDQSKVITQLDGYEKVGKHNLDPAEAGDIYVYHPEPSFMRKLAFDKASLAYIAGVIQSAAKDLKSRGEIDSLIRWGGNWDKDGVILIDQSFDDLPHHEIYTP